MWVSSTVHKLVSDDKRKEPQEDQKEQNITISAKRCDPAGQKDMDSPT